MFLAAYAYKNEGDAGKGKVGKPKVGAPGVIYGHDQRRDVP
jgi:hypothetical protein